MTQPSVASWLRRWAVWRCAAGVAHALAAAVLLAWAMHLKDPHLLPLRAFEASLLIGLAALGLVIALRGRARWWGRLWPALVLAWLAVGVLAAWGEWAFTQQKQRALYPAAQDRTLLRRIGTHLVVGYRDVEAARRLAADGLIDGVFITARNVAGKSAEQLAAEIASLQAARREHGLPPLMIATDQEGGAVSRLSPPLPRQGPLSQLVDADPTTLDARAHDYGAAQGQALSSVGVNTNFSPVLDLKPAGERGALDFHTRIDSRAIAADPAVVARVARAYSQGLVSAGVLPTAKHFPGLGHASGDTHHFSARVPLSLPELRARDWLPFRELLATTQALLMVGHVSVDALDDGLPASLSRRAITEVVRGEWGFDGVVITDDMTMGAVYNRGLCGSSVQSLNAGVDLLLIAYDDEKVYPVLDCLVQAARAGALQSLIASDARLARLPWRR